MDNLANKTAYGSAKWKRERSGARQGLAGVGLLLLASLIWLARDLIPNLATTQVIATAVFYAKESTEAQLQRAFAAARSEARTNSFAEVTFDPERNPALRGQGVTYYLSVTGDTPERAKAELTTLTGAIEQAFPSAERNLLVSPNNSTRPAPNDLSRRISFGVLAALVLMMLGGQLLAVIGAYREDQGRAGVFAAIIVPFLMMGIPGGNAGSITPRGGSLHTGNVHADWKFLLLLLALTPISVMLGVWLTRKSRAAAAQRRA